MKPATPWTDEELLRFLESEGPHNYKRWVTVRNDSGRSRRTRSRGLIELASKPQLHRLLEEFKIEARTVTFSYWKNSYSKGEPDRLIQARLRFRSP